MEMDLQNDASKEHSPDYEALRADILKVLETGDYRLAHTKTAKEVHRIQQEHRTLHSQWPVEHRQWLLTLTEFLGRVALALNGSTPHLGDVATHASTLAAYSLLLADEANRSKDIEDEERQSSANSSWVDESEMEWPQPDPPRGFAAPPPF